MVWTVYLYLGRSSKVWRCISLLVDYRTVDLYWRRSSRVWCFRSTEHGVVGYVAVDLYWAVLVE